MNRQEGYYWVKQSDIKHEVGYWNSKLKHWDLTGDSTIYQDSDFEHINEVRIKFPGELPD